MIIDDRRFFLLGLVAFILTNLLIWSLSFSTTSRCAPTDRIGECTAVFYYSSFSSTGFLGLQVIFAPLYYIGILIIRNKFNNLEKIKPNLNISDKKTDIKGRVKKVEIASGYNENYFNIKYLVTGIYLSIILFVSTNISEDYKVTKFLPDPNTEQKLQQISGSKDFIIGPGNQAIFTGDFFRPGFLTEAEKRSNYVITNYGYDSFLLLHNFLDSVIFFPVIFIFLGSLGYLFMYFISPKTYLNVSKK